MLAEPNKSPTKALTFATSSAGCSMLVTMQNSELINKLVMIADGDIDLVQRAIRDTAGPNGADLEAVVRYIVEKRQGQAAVQPERVAHVA
jgi:hypothetical protein